jgi:hypothetical protein
MIRAYNPQHYRELVRLLSEIDPDGIEDRKETVRFDRLYEDCEILGHRMRASSGDMAFLRDLHSRQMADAYGVAA